MLSVKRCREILGDEQSTDEELRNLIDGLTELTSRILDSWEEEQSFVDTFLIESAH